MRAPNAQNPRDYPGVLLTIDLFSFENNASAGIFLTFLTFFTTQPSYGANPRTSRDNANYSRLQSRRRSRRSRASIIKHRRLRRSGCGAARDQDVVERIGGGLVLCLGHGGGAGAGAGRLGVVGRVAGGLEALADEVGDDADLERRAVVKVVLVGRDESRLFAPVEALAEDDARVAAAAQVQGGAAYASRHEDR